MVEREQIINLIFTGFNYDKEMKDLRAIERCYDKNTKEFEYHIKRLGRLI